VLHLPFDAPFTAPSRGCEEIRPLFSRGAPFAFRYTFYRFLTVAAPLAESSTYGAVTVRER